MLNKIIENKRKEVEMSKKNLPLPSFKHKLKNSERDFKEAISKNKLNLIAEIKRTSPSQNILFQKHALSQNSRRVFDIIKIYNKYADAISVLTDKKFFNGTLSDLKNISRLTKLPILRKDFIIDEYQIFESRFYNADAILLIASLFSAGQLNYFIDIAGKLKMDCLVEVNNEKELRKVLKSDATIIGINNRNLSTLKIDKEITLKLTDKIPKNRIIVSESGIDSRDYVDKIKSKVNAILVGTLFMKSKNVEEEILLLIK